MTVRATYRLQFSSAFRFADAESLAPYLAALGVSHVYASPVFKARSGSTHGYDVVDPGQLNPELGGEADFRAMAQAFRSQGLGLILDIVPNHMGIGVDNAFWQSVLERGRDSPFADWFDIDWQSDTPGLRGKVLVPVLGDSYGAVLTKGGLALRIDAATDGFAIWAHDTHKLPVRIEDHAEILRDVPPAPAAERAAAALRRYQGHPGDAASWASLDALIERQHWRAAWFNLDCDAINYRRFFAVSDLAGVRVERPEVFEATHRLVLSLLEEGVIDGVRVDHIDGLADPKVYALRLRASVTRPFYLLVEKILAPDETLPRDWGVDGTTGYEFANLLVGLLVDPAGDEILSQTYAAFTGTRAAPEAIVTAAKHEIMDRRLAAELEALTTRLHRIAQEDPRTRDFGRGALRGALAEIIAAFEVYRTYVDAEGAQPGDRARIEQATKAAGHRAPDLAPEIFAFVESALTLDLCAARSSICPDIRDFVARFQQFTGPVMAKGLEDTALYRYHRLIALNEVGSAPGRFGTAIAEFHEANCSRLASEPGAMLATSTHDTKRGEDARARIAAISGHAAVWAAGVEDWHRRLASAGAPPIGRDMEYLFFQLLLGAWPVEWRPEVDIPSGAARDFAERVGAAMLKSAREAAIHTRWVFGDPDYEQRLAGFVTVAFDPASRNDFLAAFRKFEALIFPDAMRNALVQLILKLTVPGVPDLYQGADLWEQSLVDPDNRRPVDFGLRKEKLRALGETPPARVSLVDGSVKLALTQCLLDLRRRKPDLFGEGGYEPVSLRGTGRALAFARRHGSDVLIVAVALQDSTRPVDAPSRLMDLPGGCAGPFWNVLEGKPAVDLTAEDLFRTLPFAVFCNAPSLTSVSLG